MALEIGKHVNDFKFVSYSYHFIIDVRSIKMAEKEAASKALESGIIIMQSAI